MTPPLPPGPYDVILADPPWRFETWSDKGGGRSAERYYPTMSWAALAALPVSRLAAPGCVLFLWVTVPLLDDGLQLVHAWGFEYKTVAFTWAKALVSGLEIIPQLGTGYYTRANAELCLLGTRGKPPPRLDRGVSSLIVEPRREHSRKPDAVRRRIERLFGADVRRIELFARPPHRPGWDVWGLEVAQT